MNESLFTATDEKLYKGYYRGTHRFMDPAQTLSRVLPLLSGFGITRVANVTGLDWIGLPVVMVCRPNARSLAVSQGKGATLVAAKVSGIMEAIELYHAETIQNPLLLRSYADLASSAVLPSELPMVKDATFHAHAPLLWIEGYNLSARTSVWVPFDAVSTDASCPRLPGSLCLLSSSNGLASGNHPIEALSHAICEVVERDAIALWYLREREQAQRTRIDIATIDDPDCRAVIDLFEAAGMETMIWDATSDTGIPVFMCLLTEPVGGARARYSAQGMGCHPSRAVALMRAMTEAAQSRLTLISGSRDDLFRDEYEWSHLRAVDVEHYSSLTPADGALRSYRDVPSFESDSFHADLRWEIDRLADAGLDQVIAVDLTRSEHGIAVVRVVIPGLEGPSNVAERRPGARARQLIGARIGARIGAQK